MKHLFTMKMGKFLIYVMFLQCLLIGGAFAQDMSVSGRILAEDTNEGLPGVSVMIEGTTIGTVTDVNGYYKLNAPSNAMLVFSYVGYLTEKVKVDSRSTIDITLLADLTALDEVVVIGYGEVNKRDLTGAINSLNTDKIREANKVNSFQAIQGQVPGVDIKSLGNKPGSGFQVRVRGFNSLDRNGGNPLYVVDGIFVGDISSVNPADIEKIDILKDASATAVYGSRGANGVVIISTKRGEKGKTSIQYDNYFGFREAYNFPDLFNGEEFVQFAQDAAEGIGNPGLPLDQIFGADELENINNGRYVDWVDLIQQKGFQTNHTLSVSGSSDGLLYSIGGAVTFDEGTFPGEDYTRYNLRTSLSKELSSVVEVGLTGYASYELRNEGSREGFRSAVRLRPTGNVFDQNGDLQFFPTVNEGQITNPLFEENNVTRETRRLKYFGNIFIKIKPLEGVQFTTTFTPDVEFGRYGEYRGLFSKAVIGRPSRRRAIYDSQNRLAFTWDNILDLEKTINEDHHIKASLISSIWSQRFDRSDLQVRNFATDAFSFYNLNAGSDIRERSTRFEKETLTAFVARVNYTLKDKYLFTVTGRYDASSKLAEGNQWEFFPSAAVAWRIGDEDFLADQNVISDLKLRLSYGEAGNNSVAPYSSQSLIGNSFYVFGGDVVTTANVTSLVNPDLTWEITKEVNVGLDYAFFNNRIFGSLDIYNRKSEGLIFARQLPNVSGFGSIIENVGSVRNKGVEVNLNSIIVDNGTLKWSTSLNFATNTNEILEINGNGQDDVGSRLFIGEPVNIEYDYVWDGIWQTDESDEAESFGQLPGQVRVRDLDNNGVINDQDRAIIGNNLPDWTGGLTNTLSYKDFDFTIFAYTRQGSTVSSYFHRSHAWDQDNRPARFNGLRTNYWTPTNPSNEFYQPGNGGPYRSVVRYQDVSFVRVGYITLGYNFPTEFLQKFGLNSFRFYLTAQNPFTFTDYEGWDPETAEQNTWGSAFLSRTFLAGINVKF
ncbi:TonB-dependent receptor [Fulvivirgaceae bacterium BMA10]|uniref:TonB-dependent receptor n=1 Tax=Splendidivirga corallicola TaxID=3051826 RepID=A0ABT8L205_9BACT|nr:TonB-dependent receptor [Fulvivirgaceae bacterium BMA10]